MIIQNRGSLQLSLQGLVDILPNEVQSITLNVTLNAMNMQDQLVQKSIHVVLINSNRLSVALDTSSIKIAPQVSYQVIPYLIDETCTGAQRFRLNSQSVLSKYNLTMSCILTTTYNKMNIQLPNCTINPWTLNPGSDYRVRYMISQIHTGMYFEGFQSISVEEVIPYCKIQQGTSLLLQPNSENVINAVVKEDIDIRNYNLQWSCFMIDPTTLTYVPCPKLNHTNQQNQSLNYYIPANALTSATQYYFNLNILEIQTNKYLASCSVQVQTVVDLEYSVIGLQILGEVDSKSSLKLTQKSYVFVCETNQSNITKDIQYFWSLTTTSDTQQMQVNLTNTSLANQSGKYLKVDWTAFAINKAYILTCQAKSSQLAFGSTSLYFNTNFFAEDSTQSLQLEINPKTGTAFQTNFTIQGKTFSSSLFVCIVGYSQSSNNQQVVLYQSSTFEQNIDITQTINLPSGSINLFMFCQDTSGNMRQINQTIEVTKINVETTDATVLSTMLLEGAASNDSMVVLQALKLSQDLGSANTILNSTAQASLLKNSIKLLLLQTSEDGGQQPSTGSSNTLLNTNTKVEVLQSITSYVKSSTQLQKDKELVTMAVHAYLTTVQETTSQTLLQTRENAPVNTNTSGGGNSTNQTKPNAPVSIERRQNSVAISAALIEPELFDQYSKLAGDILSQSKTAELDKSVRREIVSGFLATLDSFTGNLESGKQKNDSLSNLVSYAMVKLTKNATADPKENIALLTMNGGIDKEIEIYFNASDPVFTPYENLIFKAVSFDKDTMTDTNHSIPPVKVNSTNTETVSMKLASDVLLISVDNTPDLYPLGSQYTLNQTAVDASDMVMPIIFDIKVKDAIQSTVIITTEDKNVTISKTYQCQIFNEQNQLWEKLNCLIDNGVTGSENVLYNETVFCCTRHLSMFAVVEVTVVSEQITPKYMPISYSDDNFVRIVTITFDLFFIIFAILACVFDKCNILTMYHKFNGGSNGRQSQYQDHSGNNNHNNQQPAQHLQDQQRGYGEKQANRQQDLAAYEQQYQQYMQMMQMQNVNQQQFMNVAAAQNASFDNSMMNQTQFPILANNNAVAGMNMAMPKPMDAQIRPPMQGHKVSEQDQNDQQQRYEGGSSEEEDDESQNVHVRTKQLKQNRDEKRKKKKQKTSSSKQQPVDNASAANQKDSKLFKKVKQNDDNDDNNDGAAQDGKQHAKKQSKKSSQKVQSNNNGQNNDDDSVSNNSQDKKQVKNIKSKKDSSDLKNSGSVSGGEEEDDSHDHVMTKGGDQDETHRGGKGDKKKLKDKKNSSNSGSGAKNAATVVNNGKIVLPSRGMLQPDDSESNNDSSSARKDGDDDDRPEDHSAARVLGPNNPQDSRNSPQKYLQNGQAAQDINSSFNKSISNSVIFCRAIQCYHRVFGVVFREAPNHYRVIKVVNSCAQFFLVLLITGLLTILGEMSSGGALIVTLVLMRFVQVLFNILPSKGTSGDTGYSNTCRNATAGIFFFAIFIVAQIFSMGLSRDRYQEEIDDWKMAFIITYLLEIIVMDLLINPLIVLMALRCCCPRASYRFLSPALTHKYLQDNNNNNGKNYQHSGYNQQNQHDQSMDAYKTRPHVY